MRNPGAKHLTQIPEPSLQNLEEKQNLKTEISKNQLQNATKGMENKPEFETISRINWRV